MLTRVLGFSGFALSFPFLALLAQGEAEVSYRHYEECQNRKELPPGCTIHETVRIEPGGTLRLVVTDTWEELFEITFKGYTSRRPEEPTNPPVETAQSNKFTTRPTQTISREVVHSSKYGGYVFAVAPRAGVKLPMDGEADKVRSNVGSVPDTIRMPGPALIIVQVDRPNPPYAFSGGMSFATLKNPAFVARPAASAGTYTIVQDDTRDDAATVGFATFINFRPFKKRDWFWPGIGIGLETKGHTQYYVSVGFKVVDGVFFNPGLVLGQVAMLPAGLQVGDNITDPNRLAQMETRKDIGLFLGFSFRFLGGGQETFGRPFLGAGP